MSTGDHAFVHDPRHRHSYELRPDPALDAAIRELAARLEQDGLLEPGASTAPRFQPHLTLFRASTVIEPAILAAADAVRRFGADVTFAVADTFGGGRILYLVPTPTVPVGAARQAALDHVEADVRDPLVAARPWLPHLTVAYAVPDGAREAALAAVRAALPLRGSWAVAQAWDLDVRPTRLCVEAPCVRVSDPG